MEKVLCISHPKHFKTGLTILIRSENISTLYLFNKKTTLYSIILYIKLLAFFLGHSVAYE